jgi:GNAT superfamily N-acetyltransferase
MDIRKIQPRETWNIRHKVLWPEIYIEYVKLAEDDYGEHYGLFVEEKLISIISIFKQQNSVQFRKFATLSEEQNKGYGTILLNYIFEQVQKQGYERIWCNARTEKTTYYEKFGMRKTNDMYIRLEIEYVIMEKLLKTDQTNKNA